jgi:hypothetical protein
MEATAAAEPTLPAEDTTESATSEPASDTAAV